MPDNIHIYNQWCWQNIQ